MIVIWHDWRINHYSYINNNAVENIWCTLESIGNGKTSVVNDRVYKGHVNEFNVQGNKNCIRSTWNLYNVTALLSVRLWRRSLVDYVHGCLRVEIYLDKISNKIYNIQLVGVGEKQWTSMNMIQHQDKDLRTTNSYDSSIISLALHTYQNCTSV